MSTNETGSPGALRASLGLAPGDAAARLLERVRRYVTMETPSADAERIAGLSGTIEAELLAAGAAVEAFDAPGKGRNLRAVIPGELDGAGHLVLLGHIDTVHPVGTLASQPFAVVDGRVEGPGVYDMKTGVAIMVEALALLHGAGRRPRRPVHLLVTCDEEIGSHSSRPLIASSAQGAVAALVPEPCTPDGGIKTQRKGVATYRLETYGRAAHAGIEPQRAVSATTELAHQMLAILELADHAAGTTLTFGMIGGGTASNVVPARAWATIDVRYRTAAEGERVAVGLRTLAPHLAGARIDITLTESRPPLERSEAVVALYRHARQLAADLGVDLPEGATGGGSDGSLIASLGVPALDGLGARGGGAHAIDEHVVLADLPFRLALMKRLLETL